MKLCLIVLGRFFEDNGELFIDKKNIKAINRYTKYFDSTVVIAQKMTDKNNSLYDLEKTNFNENIEIKLYDDYKNIFDIFNHIKKFKKILEENVKECDFIISWAEHKTHIVKKIADKYNKPNLVVVAASFKDSLLSTGSIVKIIAYFILSRKFKKAIMKSNYVHYVTNTVLQNEYPTKGKSIGASDVNIIKDNIKKIPSKNEWEKKERVVIGLIGYLKKIKGIDTAIKALTKLDKKYVLKILGGGDKKYYIKLANKLGVSNRVFFDGTLTPGAEVYEWLKQIDIYIQPSRSEGLPRATIEAMSIGLPIISSDQGGLKELISKKFRHKKGDWKSLAALIDLISNDYSELVCQSKINFEKAKNYDREKLDKKIDNFLKKIIEESSL